jgi:hypothetical protein
VVRNEGETLRPEGTRTKTSKGPATSKEASPHPVLFETLEYREQNPIRVGESRFGGGIPEVHERRVVPVQSRPGAG